ncbi:hypothetical protein D3C81_2194480 [compost metagenome]
MNNPPRVFLTHVIVVGVIGPVQVWSLVDPIVVDGGESYQRFDFVVLHWRVLMTYDLS